MPLTGKAGGHAETCRSWRSAVPHGMSPQLQHVGHGIGWASSWDGWLGRRSRSWS